MPAVIFHGFAHGAPYTGRITGEKPWRPGVYEIPGDDAAILIRDFAAHGPNGGPAFESAPELPPAPSAPPAPAPPPKRR